MLTFEANAVSTSDTGLTVHARDFEWLVDEPPSLGGGDKGPNPVEYTLGSLLGCLNVVVHLIAKERGVTLTSFSASAKGELDPTKFLGQAMDVRAGYQSIAVTIEVEGDATDEQLAEIAAAAEQRCPVSDNISHETPVSIGIVKKA